MPELLHSYQIAGAEWLAARRVGLLLDEMGLGKTATSIRACDLVEAKLILIVCPAIATMVWSREFSRWQQIGRRSRSSAPAPRPNSFAAT